jgi:poly-gamma-glutamate synthesis protein (capsule biosynthesis protein)
VATRLLLCGAAAVLLLIVACGGSADDHVAALQPLLNPTDSPAPTPTPAPSYSTPAPPLTTDDIFPPRDLSQYNLDPSRIRTIIATGDVIPARHTDYIIRGMNNDFEYTVDATKDIISDADITVINLESPLIEGCPEEAGVDLATLENNHIGNYGSDGITETEQHLEAAGIKWADSYDPAIIDVRGMKFGFLAFNGVGGPVDQVAMKQQIEALRPQVDVLSVAFHWGMEYVPLPIPAPGIADDDPVELAHAAIDDGADFIIGNHPHWVQSVEIYKGKYITYAHGNFIFDQEWSYETTVGVIGKYTFFDDTLIGVEYIPVHIENYAQPVPMVGDERQAVLDTMKQDTIDLAAKLTAQGY